jgi:CheY-like chemotaxis protein
MIKQNYMKREAMELLTQYQNELIGLLILFLSLYLVVLLKRNKKKQEREKELEKVDEKLTKKENIQETQEIKSNKEISQEQQEQIEEIILEGAEEGDFGVDEALIKEVDTPTHTTKKAYKKRDVPSHQKIIKDDFKEFQGTRILIAEDNIINQKVIQGLLAESGIEIVMADDGIETLEILQHDNNFSLILMDAHMPRLDGFETTKKIRMNPEYNHIPVIALSGDTAANDIRKMQEAGMVEHLEKPLKMDALYDVLYAYTNIQNHDMPNTSLDTEEGLYICGGDENFYKEILQEFLSNYTNSAQELTKLIHNNQLQEADKLLLDIIGVAANIGATKLTQIAQKLKSVIYNKENDIDSLLQTYTTELTTLVHTITTYLQDK